VQLQSWKGSSVGICIGLLGVCSHRYQLLFAGILQRTDDDHADHANIVVMHKRMASLCEQMNEIQCDRDSRRRCQKLARESCGKKCHFTKDEWAPRVAVAVCPRQHIWRRNELALLVQVSEGQDRGKLYESSLHEYESLYVVSPENILNCPNVGDVPGVERIVNEQAFIEVSLPKNHTKPTPPK